MILRINLKGAAWWAYLFLYPKRGRGGVLERDLNERGLNIEITVPPFLPLLSQTCCRGGGNYRG
jgi:hypothetical protein